MNLPAKRAQNRPKRKTVLFIISVYRKKCKAPGKEHL